MKKSMAILTNVSEPYKALREKMQINTYLGLLI